MEGVRKGGRKKTIMDRDALEAHPKYEKIKELGQGRYIILFSMVILR